MLAITTMMEFVLDVKMVNFLYKMSVSLSVVLMKLLIQSQNSANVDRVMAWVMMVVLSAIVINSLLMDIVLSAP